MTTGERPGALLPRSFFARDALEVARDLLGQYLVRDDVVVRITETEAYRHPDDTANHCRAGRTERNAPMWGPPGRCYVYVIYGMHPMLNLVTGDEGSGEAVLVRSAEPVAGLQTMQARRGGRTGPALTAGPGRLARALGLDVSFNGHPVTRAGGLEARRGAAPPYALVGPRVGVDYASEEHRAAPWRFASPDTPWISTKRGLAPEPGAPVSDRGARRR